tara:strand:- start:1420 stop:2022 length:603 start_codon:yes stop_codon:yes gene_type:complete
MSKYFKFFPTTNYPFTDDNTIVTTVTNVLKRMRVRPELEQNISFYQTYLVKGHDTPEIVSEKAYGSPEYHWVVMLINNITDGKYGFLLNDRALTAFVEQKYKGDTFIIENSDPNWPNHLVYENTDQIILEETKSATSNADAIHHYEDDDGFEVLSNAPFATAVSNREYEEILNEEKREINILKKEYLSQFVAEFETQIGL